MTKRTGIRAAFAGMALVLAVGSIGFACTIFLGQMSVRGKAANPETGKKETVTIIGNTQGMSYCYSPGRPVTGRLVPESAGHTFVENGPGNPAAHIIEVSVAPYADPRDATGNYGNDPGSCTGQLPDGLYDVNFSNGPAYSNVAGIRRWNLDCMYNNHGGDPTWADYSHSKLVGTMNVVGGSASGEYNLGNILLENGPGDESAVCVSNQPPREGLYGLQAPITVL